VHVGRPSIGDHTAFLRRAAEILDRGWLSNDGPVVRELEERIAGLLGVGYCIAMCNGTVALEIAIRALDLTGEVIIPSYTFIATAHALQWQGITPVFADINPVTHNLEPTSVHRLITPRTTGIIGVHLWGRPAPHSELASIAAENGLRLLYDAAHAFGCTLNGEMIGCLASCEVLSFHATKVFNTFEGGAVVTDDGSLAAKMRLMRNFGFEGYDNVIHPGTNGKMTEIAAAMGLTNLDRLDAFVEANRQNYHEYRDGLGTIPGLKLLRFDETERCNYQYIVVEVEETFPVSRDEVIAVLHAENVLARRYFWPGCHRMKPYRDLYLDAGLMLPNTISVADRVIVLPTGSGLPEGAIKTILAVLRCLASG
jgi:dTDP-4-amino-4,6-dideoxygalactose transaminase